MIMKLVDLVFKLSNEPLEGDSFCGQNDPDREGVIEEVPDAVAAERYRALVEEARALVNKLPSRMVLEETANRTLQLAVDNKRRTSGFQPHEYNDADLLVAILSGK